MAAALRLITDELMIYSCSPDKDKLISQKTYIIPPPEGSRLVVCFASNKDSISSLQSLVETAIKNNFGIIYVCGQLPIQPIIDPHIVYIEAPTRWFIHTLFINPLRFSCIFSDNGGLRLAQAFSEFTGYHIPLVKTQKEFDTIIKNSKDFTKSILIEVTGGLGDHLLVIPTIKTLAAQGFLVSVLCEAHRNPCYQNLPYVKTMYTSRRDIDVSKFHKLFYLHFGQQLNDYRLELNKQNRIYAVAELCGLRKEDLVIDRPEIILTADEINNAQRKYGSYSNKLFFGGDSARIDAKLSSSLVQEKINLLKAKGFTVFSSSIRRDVHENCIDLNKKLSVRELFAIISLMDCVLTVDTAFLHIAGAFNKKTFALINYFKSDWRCGTYLNTSVYTPNVSCYPCFPENTLVNTEFGLKKIQDVVIGERVLTHKGNFLPVIKTFKKPFEGELIGIKSKGWGDSIYSTPEHPYYSFDRKRWVEANDLTIKEHLVRPKYLGDSIIHTYDLKNYSNNLKVEFDSKYIRQVSSVKLNNSRLHKLSRFIPLDASLARLIGYYLSEGSLKDAVVRFTFHQNETKYIRDVFKLMKTIFGISGSQYKALTDKSIQLAFSSVILSNFFGSLCGRNSLKVKIKHLPPEIWKSSQNTQRALLQGFINGDAQKTDKSSFVIGICEETLADDLYALSTQLGLSCAYTKRIQKPNPFHKMSWWLYKIVISKRSFYNSKQLYYHRQGDYEIEALNKKIYSGNVYNLEVLQDNSYCVMGYAVHNCVARQFVAASEWQCHKTSCYEYFDWDKIISDIYDFKFEKASKVTEVISTVVEPIPLEPEISESITIPEVITKNKKILYARWDEGLGDWLILTAGLKSLNAYYPDCSITVACLPQYADLFKNNPYVAAIITNQSLIQKKDYDYIFDCTRFFEHEHYPQTEAISKGEGRIDLLYKDMLKIPAIDRRPIYFITPSEKKQAKTLLSQYPHTGKIITMHIASNGVVRNYPIEYFYELQTLLFKAGITTVLVGSKQGVGNKLAYSAINKPGLVNLTGLSLRETAAIINESDLLLAVDSGYYHLAAALNKNTVVLFGNIQPKARILYYETVDELYPAGIFGNSYCPCNDALWLHGGMQVCGKLEADGQSALCMFVHSPQKVFTKILMSLNKLSLKSIQYRPKLSFAMMTHNEEDMIEGCIKRIYDIADEIIVVDDSTDKTREILKKFSKVKVFTMEDIPCPSYCNYCKENNIDLSRIGRPCSAKLRSFSFSKCTGDWIFRLDADETLCNEDLKKLRLLVDYSEEMFPGVKIFWFPTVNFFLDDKHYKVGAQTHNWFPDWHKRLHRNEARFHKWVQPAHERMVDYDEAGNLKYLDDVTVFPWQHLCTWFNVFHYGYLQPKKDRVIDARKYEKMGVLLHVLDKESVEPWVWRKPEDVILPDNWGSGQCEYETGERG